jgi:hypothetical protein
MATENRSTVDDTSRTEKAAGRVASNREPKKEGLSDQDRAEMKKSLEDAGYKVKDAVTE